MIGYFGFMNTSFLQKIDGVLPESSAIIFDFDYSFLKTPTHSVVRFQALPRYQASSFDVSFLTPASTTYDSILQGLSGIDSSIVEVRLVDSFTKKEWLGKRSLTFRCKIVNPTKTMTREEIDNVYAKVVRFASENNLIIRD